jgi:carbamoyl-phosphate synthase large subunit
MTFTILRTAAGSAVAPSVIQALKSLPDVRVIAVDAASLSCGFHLADAHYVVPPVQHPDYLKVMLQICLEERVDLFFPDLDEELPLLAEAREEFQAAGTRVLVSSPKAIRSCFDKYRTFQFLRKRRIPTPNTCLAEEFRAGRGISFPLIVKPRQGRGSQKVFKVTNSEELEFFQKYVPGPIVQEFWEGMEYTIDTLSDLEGNFLYCSIRQRLATDSGISIKGRTLSHPGIEQYSRRIVEGLGIVGPACLQCIENGKGELRFIEVNPRIGGGIALSLAAGAPILSDIVRLVRGEEPEGLKNYQTGLLMLRHWQEIFYRKP